MVVIVTPPASDYKPLKIKKSEFNKFIDKQSKRLKFFSIIVVVVLLLINLTLTFPILVNSSKVLTLQLINIAISVVVGFLALKDRRKIAVINELKNTPGDEIALKPDFTGLFKRDIFVILLGYVLLSILLLVLSLS